MYQLIVSQTAEKVQAGLLMDNVLMEYYEFEDRPYVHRRTVSAAELTAGHIREIDGAEIWNKPDRMYPERPSFYCLRITA